MRLLGDSRSLGFDSRLCCGTFLWRGIIPRYVRARVFVSFDNVLSVLFWRRTLHSADHRSGKALQLLPSFHTQLKLTYIKSRKWVNCYRIQRTVQTLYIITICPNPRLIFCWEKSSRKSKKSKGLSGNFSRQINRYCTAMELWY